MEVRGENLGRVVETFREAEVPCICLGRTVKDKSITITAGSRVVLSRRNALLRDSLGRDQL